MTFQILMVCSPLTKFLPKCLILEFIKYNAIILTMSSLPFYQIFLLNRNYLVNTNHISNNSNNIEQHRCHPLLACKSFPFSFPTSFSLEFRTLEEKKIVKCLCWMFLVISFIYKQQRSFQISSYGGIRREELHGNPRTGTGDWLWIQAHSRNSRCRSSKIFPLPLSC